MVPTGTVRSSRGTWHKPGKQGLGLSSCFLLVTLWPGWKSHPVSNEKWTEWEGGEGQETVPGKCRRPGHAGAEDVHMWGWVGEKSSQFQAGTLHWDANMDSSPGQTCRVCVTPYEIWKSPLNEFLIYLEWGWVLWIMNKEVLGCLVQPGFRKETVECSKVIGRFQGV